MAERSPDLNTSKLVLIASGSFDPITNYHIRIFGKFTNIPYFVNFVFYILLKDADSDLTKFIKNAVRLILSHPVQCDK
jgi:nicotinic acid mononucleotide adenylyltransferase